MTSEVMVSVYCMAYNHEKYIRDALEGFVRQKTNFKYEVFVHDDASTDHTAQIIAEYADKYPDIIKPIYQKENQYSKGIGIVTNFILPRMQGQYIAVCEGDDYWCDENKLQRQFDFLQTHPEYVACVHNTTELNCRTGRKRVLYDPKQDHDLTFEEVMDYGSSAFHTSAVFYRREYFNVPEALKANGFGDYPLAVYLRLNGKIYRFKEIMSVYRIFADGSWTTQNMGSISQERIIRTQTRTADFTAKASRYCRETQQSPEIQAAADDVANRDHLQLMVMQRGGRCLLLDSELRRKFLHLTAEKKQYVLSTVWGSWMRKLKK